MAIYQGTVQTSNFAAGSQPSVSLGRQADQLASELHGRFYTQCYNGQLYSWGKTSTALSANSISLTATTTPIIGVWNPSGSTVNLVILQSGVQIFPNNLTSGAGPGALVWATSTGNAVVSAGNTPLSRKTLANAGSQAKGFDLATALTGITNNLVIQEEADFSNPTGLTYTTLASTALMYSTGGVQNFDGQLIVPPGVVLALLNTTSCTTFSATSRILWEEVAL
jgi:hypothetical protein